VAGNTIDRTAGDGILVTDDENARLGGTGANTYSDNVTIIDNTIANAGYDATSAARGGTDIRAGLYILHADDVTLTGNTISRSFGQNERITTCVACAVN